MRRKFRFRLGKGTLISSVIGYIGYFIVNDLKKENSLIKNTFRKIPLIKNKIIKDNNKLQENSNNIRVINEYNEMNPRGEE